MEHEIIFNSLFAWGFIIGQMRYEKKQRRRLDRENRRYWTEKVVAKEKQTLWIVRKERLAKNIWQFNIEPQLFHNSYKSNFNFIFVQSLHFNLKKKIVLKDILSWVG